MNKFFNFLQGYVIIKVYGKHSARFINICLRRSIRIYGTEPIDGGVMITLRACDFPALRPIARKCRVKVKIAQKRGLWHMGRLYRKRYVFALTAVICIVFWIVSAQFIWLVEVNGASDKDIDSIISSLEEIGVKRGALKRSLPEGIEMKRAVVNGTDSVAWAWVYIEGAKARVEIYEKIMPPDMKDESVPCDIVAARDGVIRTMVVKKGEKQLAEGSAVSAGDVIVSGRVSTYREGYGEEYIYVHADASVMAYTTHTRTQKYALRYDSATPTGRHTRRFVFDLFGKAAALPAPNIKYDDYNANEKRYEINVPFFGYSGIAVSVIRYDEVNRSSEPLSVETAVEFAKNEIEEKISKELLPSAELMNETVEYEQTDNETISVTVTMNFMENIAAQVERGAMENEGEELFDKQKDRGALGG